MSFYWQAEFVCQLTELNHSFSRSCSHIHILLGFMVFASLSLHTEHGTIAKQYANRVICQFVSYVVGCQKFVHVIASTNFHVMSQVSCKFSRFCNGFLISAAKSFYNSCHETWHMSFFLYIKFHIIEEMCQRYAHLLKDHFKISVLCNIHV